MYRELESRMLKFVHRNWGWLLFTVLLSTFFFGMLFFYPVTTTELDRAPNFAFRGFDDDVFNLEEFRGRPIILNFWAAWCIFCRREMPLLEKLYQEYKDEGLVVFGIHRSETESEKFGLEFAHEAAVTYPLIRDPNENIFRHFGRGSNITPLTILINREGFIEEVIIGPRHEEQFKKLIETIL